MSIDSPAQHNGDAMDTTADPTSTSKRLAVTVQKPIPYTFDLGNLACMDVNPLPPSTTISEADIAAAARDCAQGLLNQLLSTCPLTKGEDSVTLTLPAPATPLPREKPVPADKPMTKWQEFARKKGIKAKTRDGNLVYDEEKGEWVPKWGYKGKNKDGENDWLVEVDEKKEKKDGAPGDARAEKREERRERIKRQERKERNNTKKQAERRSAK